MDVSGMLYVSTVDNVYADSWHDIYCTKNIHLRMPMQALFHASLVITIISDSVFHQLMPAL